MSRSIEQYLALALCAVALHGCGNSTPADPADRQPLSGHGEPVQPADGDGVQPGEGTAPVLVHPPLEDTDEFTAIGPEGDSHVSLAGRSFPLDSALGDIWGYREDHYNVNFTVTNGKFVVTPTQIDDQYFNLLTPVAATAIFYAEMHSPGKQFSFVTYSHSAFGAGGGVLAGTAYFDQAYIGVDTDDSGEVDADERLPVVGGTIDFSGLLPDIELHFSVLLENGQLAEGHYTGLFDFTDRQ
ncbi:MAG: hypothetical protein HKN42_10640 [Granulosicoccus sp.]|nr:hypothetical protein [Granulosicoccus sp.]